jgi:hypothetical protein
MVPVENRNAHLADCLEANSGLATCGFMHRLLCIKYPIPDRGRPRQLLEVRFDWTRHGGGGGGGGSEGTPNTELETRNPEIKPKGIKTTANLNPRLLGFRVSGAGAWGTVLTSDLHLGDEVILDAVYFPVIRFSWLSSCGRHVCVHACMPAPVAVRLKDNSMACEHTHSGT